MSVNKVILVGNVGKDPDVRYIDTGVAVANFTLATTERGYTTANGTVVPDKTEWHNIVLWRKLAEMAEIYIKKGSKLYIEGKIRTRLHNDALGNKRSVTEIYGETVEFFDRKAEYSPTTPEHNERQSTEGSASTKSNPQTEDGEIDVLPF